MFKKKNKNEQQPSFVNLDYTRWEQDLGFLTLLINKKLATEKTYNIERIPDITQGSIGGANDADVMNATNELTLSILESLSRNYIDFLVFKYFNDLQALTQFIDEIVYESLYASAVASNINKIKTDNTEKLASKIIDMNNKK